jgi:hypothetical protein
MPRRGNPLSFRLLPATKRRLDRAAADDSRSVSSFLEKLVTDWLRENGYLEARERRRANRASRDQQDDTALSFVPEHRSRRGPTSRRK